jgi:hypothetical protein
VADAIDIQAPLVIDRYAALRVRIRGIVDRVGRLLHSARRCRNSEQAADKRNTICRA